MFLGFKDGTKGYILYDLEHHNIFSPDMLFFMRTFFLSILIILILNLPLMYHLTSPTSMLTLICPFPLLTPLIFPSLWMIVQPLLAYKTKILLFPILALIVTYHLSSLCSKTVLPLLLFLLPALFT